MMFPQIRNTFGATELRFQSSKIKSPNQKEGFKEARKGFFGCYSVCETMKDTKEGYFIM